MNPRKYSFWMGGKYATNLLEETADLSRLSDGNFWAVSISYEGEVRLARFSDVTNVNFPKLDQEWKRLSGSWESTLSESEFCLYVERVRKLISEGQVYQVNACRRLSISSDNQSLDSLFSELLDKNPAPYSCYLSLPELEIASASPELFLDRTGAEVRTSPIKGTQQLSEDGFGNKDQSENVMIVDLMRNDLGQICEPGSIQVANLLRSENHPGLRHLVSDVTGKLRAGIEWEEIFQRLLPAGSISGTPKSSALEVIRQNEEVIRGPYCGVLGWVQGDRAVLSVAIRIFWCDSSNELNFGTGAGITWGSEPTLEWQETQLKASRLISIAGGELL
jgi:para-aminobenzoate synthetase component 1